VRESQSSRRLKYLRTNVSAPSTAYILGYSIYLIKHTSKHTLILSSIFLFTHSLSFQQNIHLNILHLSICQNIQLFIQSSLICPFITVPIYSSIYPFIYLSSHSFIHLLNHSLILKYMHPSLLYLLINILLHPSNFTSVLSFINTIIR
jgi:hypothetical protein